MDKILITGGAGFVGFHLAKKLSNEKNNEVTIIDNFERSRKDKDFEQLLTKENVYFHDLDLSSESSYDALKMNYYDVIYHLAAINGTSNFYDIPARVLKVCTYSTINLLDWVSKHDKRPVIIYTSSSEAYAGTARMLGKNFKLPTPEDVPLSIDDVKNVRWSYGAGKLIGEVALYSYRKSHGIDNFMIARLHNAYGPRMGRDHVISQFVERYRSSTRPFEIFGGSNTRSFCHIDDVLDALEHVRFHGEKGEIYHIGNDDEEISIEELAKLIFDINREKYNFKVYDAPEGSVERRCPNIDKIKKLGHKKRVSLRDGLEKTFRWYNER